MKALKLGLTMIVILIALTPTSVGAQSANTYASIILTDVLSGAPVVDGTFTTDLQISVTNNAPPEVGVMGAEIWVAFDPEVVNVDDTDNNPANGTQVEIKNDFFDGNLVIGANEVLEADSSHPAPCDTMSCVHIAISHTGSGPVTNKTGVLATITWASVAPGSCDFAVAVVPPGVPPGSVLSDSDGQPISINSVSVPSITVGAAGVIKGYVWRQGTQTDHAGTEVVAMTINRGQAGSTVTDADGSFSLEVPVGSTYTINAWYPGYLHLQKNDVYIVGAEVSIGPAQLVGGDVKNDNCINILDAVLIINRFGETGLSPEEAVDINDDGKVDILDLTITAGNFTRCGPTTWKHH
jgi:hypothetical protein